MLKLTMLLSAATLALATPAMAQIGIRAGDNGVSVRIGEGDRHHHHHRGDRHRHRGHYDGGDCRTTRITTFEHGRRITKTIRKCD